MLKAAGCSHVIIGHSERRQYFHETEPEVVFKKTEAALEAGVDADRVRRRNAGGARRR